MNLTIVAWPPERGQKIPSSLKRSVKKLLKRARIDGEVSIVPGCLLIAAKNVSSDDVVYALRILQGAGYNTGVQV